MAWTNKKTANVIGAGVALLIIILTTIVRIERMRAHYWASQPTGALSPISKSLTINVQPDGSVSFQATIEETNTTRLITHADRDSDGSEKLTRITDDSGKPMKFIRQHGGYFIQLNKAVPPGGTVSYTVEGRVNGFINPNNTGVCRVEFEGTDGNSADMHCVEVWRLPLGATLLKKEPELEASTNAGQIELRIDQTVPPNGWLKLAFSYRLPPNLR